MELFEPTLDDIREMRTNMILVEKFLPFMLDTIEADLMAKLHVDAAVQRWDKFKEKMANRHFMSEGSGI